ncbi:kinase-like protein [Thelephora ganbajun]|uniref:Kinase-like protein n=1 Tax=Thelephora ganbajun TaxID=370292 RepID=A0ACB6ZM13_THEGA|nr:kinase-like protein [Thelephora ganbajun]
MSYLSQCESSLSPLVAGRQLSFLDFQVVSLIGAGSSGSVYHVVDKVTSRDFAMKIIPTGSENAELALREYFTLREVAGAPFTVTLRGFFSDDINYYLLTDYYPSGDIHGQVDRTGKMTSSQVRYFVAELIIALERVHSKRVIHRDVNPTNILVDEEGHIALADFGVSRSFDEKPTGSYAQSGSNPFVTSTECGTPVYNSPEVARGQSYSFEADLWAVGVIMYQILTHRLPFGLAECEAAGWEVGDAIHFVPLAVEDSDKIDKIAFDFMDRVLRKDVKGRMSLEEMKNHIYFAGINFDTLSKRKSGRPFPSKIRGSRRVPSIRTPPPINHSDDPCTIKTYFIDKALKPIHPRLFMRLGARLGRFIGKSVKAKFAPHSSTPAACSLSTVSEVSTNGGNLHRRSKKPYFFEPLDWGEDSSSAETPKGQSALYPGPRLPSAMREEILSRRKSAGARRRVSPIVDGDRVDETSPTGFCRLGLARSGPAVWDLASMALSPVMEGEEDGEGTEEKWNSSPHATGLARSEAAYWDLLSLA